MGRRSVDLNYRNMQLPASCYWHVSCCLAACPSNWLRPWRHGCGSVIKTWAKLSRFELQQYAATRGMLLAWELMHSCPHRQIGEILAAWVRWCYKDMGRSSVDLNYINMQLPESCYWHGRCCLAACPVELAETLAAWIRQCYKDIGISLVDFNYMNMQLPASCYWHVS